MIAFATFDSAILNTLQDAVDHAWRHLPSEQRTSEIKDRMAKAVMLAAARGERDPNRLDAIAAAAVRPQARETLMILIRDALRGAMHLGSIVSRGEIPVWCGRLIARRGFAFTGGRPRTP